MSELKYWDKASSTFKTVLVGNKIGSAILQPDGNYIATADISGYTANMIIICKFDKTNINEDCTINFDSNGIRYLKQGYNTSLNKRMIIPGKYYTLILDNGSSDFQILEFFGGVNTNINSDGTSLYVDSVSGNDSNLGTVSSPFKTIQGLIDTLPKFLIKPVNIVIIPGTTSPGFTLEGFVGNSLYMTFYSSCTVTGDIIIKKCSSAINIGGITTILNNYISIDNNIYVAISSFSITASSSGHGISSDKNSFVSIQNCTISNKEKAIYNSYGTLYSHNNNGTNNGSSLQCTYGGTIIKSSTQPSSGSGEMWSYGGLIR